MKCKSCGHAHKGVNPCNVVLPGQPPGRAITESDLCNCPEFVEMPNLPVCPECGETLSVSHTLEPLSRPPYLFACIWCNHCRHIVTAQVVIALAPPPADGKVPQSNIHVPGWPLS